MKVLGVILTALLFFSCNKEKLRAPDAFFLKTSAVSVNTISAQGTSDNKITDIWLYVNNSFKGAYPVGSSLPIQTDGSAQIRLLAGIKNNGISATRQPYEFYEPIILDTSAKTGTTFERPLRFSYKSSAKFLFMEAFEGGSTGINMIASMGSDLSSFNTVNGFEGTSMQFALDDTYKVGQFQSASFFPMPIFGAALFLELNYKCDQPFDVGVVSGSSFKPAVTVNKSASWNKIYVQLSTAASTEPTSTNQGFYIKAIKDASVSNPQFFIDNIKIISY